MIHTVAMLSRRRRYCQQCGTGSGSCFQQPGRWFALYIREVVSNRVYHLIPDYGGHKFSTSDRHACGIKSANFQKRGVKCTHPTDSLLQISSDVIAVKLVAVLYREGLINHTVYRQVTAQYSALVKPVKQ